MGWHIRVSRQADGGLSPAGADSQTSVDLAVWQTGIDGLAWVDELVRQGNAIGLGGNGYPFSYTSKAQYVLPRIGDGPPEAREFWHSDPQDILMDGWLGKTTIDGEAVRDCASDEWLLIVAWDES
jgi:hypothetical protein